MGKGKPFSPSNPVAALLKCLCIRVVRIQVELLVLLLASYTQYWSELRIVAEQFDFNRCARSNCRYSLKQLH